MKENNKNKSKKRTSDYLSKIDYMGGIFNPACALLISFVVFLAVFIIPDRFSIEELLAIIIVFLGVILTKIFIIARDKK